MKFRNHLLAALTDSDRAALVPFLSEVALDAGETLYEPENRVEVVYFPSHATLSVVSVMRNGDSVECGTVGRESAVGLLAALTGEAAGNRAVCQIAGSAMSLPAAVLRERAMASADLLNLLLRHLQLTIAQEEQSVACNATHPVPARLARWLLLSQDRSATKLLPLTQEYLAAVLGVQRATVSAAAGLLRDEGLIHYSRGQIQILDRPGLERRSCECYAAVRKTLQRLLGATAAVAG